jgi:hypothetical protein
MTTLNQYGAISFANELAAQERDIKLAALNSLNNYFKEVQLPLHGDGFWGHVEDFAEETDGLDSTSFEDIIRVPISEIHLQAIEGLGFKVGVLYAG